MKKIQFNYPFCCFDHLTFLNCFTSVFMHLQKITGTDLKECVKEKGKGCTGCKGCDNVWHSIGFIQESLFFVFGTMSGVNSFRPDFDSSHKGYQHTTPDIIDFLFKFIGYDYETLTGDFSQKIKMSIDNDKPVLARIRDDYKNTYRVLIGYCGEQFIIAEDGDIKNDPDSPITCDNFSSAIVINEKVKPQYTLLDALKRIQAVMRDNEEKAIWDSYIQKFKYWDENLKDADFDEIKKRFARIEQIAFCNFNTHNFAEAFCRQMWDLVTGDGTEFKDEHFLEIIRKINCTYSGSGFHDHNWQLHALNVNRDWSVRHTGEPDWAYCGCVVQTLESLKEYDRIVLDEINKAIDILKTKTKKG